MKAINLLGSVDISYMTITYIKQNIPCNEHKYETRLVNYYRSAFVQFMALAYVCIDRHCISTYSTIETCRIFAKC